MSSKKTTTSEQHQTQMPVVPSFVSSALQNLTQGTEALAGRDPTSFVAPQNDLQKQANAGAAALGGWTGMNDQAANLARQAASGGANVAAPALQAGMPTVAPVAQTSAPTTGPASTYNSTDAHAAGVMDGGIAKYLNPELQNVVNASLSDFDNNAGVTRAAQEAKGAAAGAFGGSRFGIAQAQTEDNLARARGTLDSTLRSNAFNDATNLANEDANRTQQTGLSNASASNAAAGQNATQQNALQQLMATLTAAANNQNASATNAVNTNAFNTQADLNKTNAASGNQVNEFNAGQKDNALTRLLQSSGLLGELAQSRNQGQIADVGAQSQVGAAQQATDQAIRTAPLALQQAIASLLGANQFGLLTGQKMDGTGKSTTTESNPLGAIGSAVGGLGSLIAAPFTGGASLAGLFAPMGGSGGGMSSFADLMG